MTNWGKTEVYLNVMMKLLRIKLKAELLKMHQSHTVGENLLYTAQASRAYCT